MRSWVTVIHLPTATSLPIQVFSSSIVLITTFSAIWAILLFQRKSYLERYLPVSDLAVLDMAAGLGYGEPVYMADGLGGLCDCFLHGILDAYARRTGELEQLVDMVCHGAS